MGHETSTSERALILAPHGRDATVASAVLSEASLDSFICADVATLRRECEAGAGLALVVEEILQVEDYTALAHWIDSQPAWSDFPIVVLARRGGGLERTPAAQRFARALGNVSFLERPFHPTTLVSVAKTALRGRRRQYEARDRLRDLSTALLQREQDEAHLRLMVNELNHRVKNTLATVQSMAAQTVRGGADPQRAQEAFTSRLMALSSAHNVLTEQRWAGAELHEVVEGAARTFSDLPDDRFVTRGPPVWLPPKAALALSMALHELGTNASKYGSLSTPEGSVLLEWSAPPAGHGRRLELVWREQDGPPVTPPDRKGFGSRLLERGLAAELGGAVTLQFRPEGLVCHIEADLEPTG
ncbi:MAG: HWE histidine kinase domain-containing protein [Phenylobacterium sp.]|nr:HWE histidine kinase domain-containing protein [Phenylobacterium sp.]